MSGTGFPGSPSDEPDTNAQPVPPGQPGQYPPPSGQQPGQYPPPGGQQPGQYPPPSSGQYPPPGGQQPGQYPPPAGQQPGQYPPSSGQPSGQYPPAGAQQSSYAYGQPPGGPPTGGSGNSKALWIILAAVAAVVVIALIAVVALVVTSGGNDEGGDAGAVSASTQPKVVKAYLTAVAEGDAKKALALSAVQPLTKDFLTDDVLAESAKIAKITDIRVGEVANEYTSTVPATFKVGEEVVTEDFSVTKSGDSWKMRQAGSELDFTTMRNNTLPLSLNGKSLEVDKVILFPGTYAVSSGTDYVTYGDTGQFTVKGNSDYLRSSELSPTLSPEGERAFVQAVKASTRACLQKKELSPANCPNQAGNSQTYKIEKGTIQWSQRGTDAFANLKPRLDYENPNLAEVRPSLQLTIKANCSAPSGRCTLNTYNSDQATIDMTKEPLAVKWVQ